MRDYGIVSPKFWIGETGKRLRKDPGAQVLALYLMTSPHATMTGVYHCPMLYMAHETGLGDEGASKALARLIEEGFCEYEASSEYIFVVNMAFWQIAESLKPGDHRIKGLMREVDKMHKAFKARFLQVYAQPFLLSSGDKQTQTSQAPSQPLISQDQDQDQDQETDVELHSTSAGGKNGKHAGVPGDVEQLFDHWREVWKHPKAQLDKKRRKYIQDALRMYSLEDLRSSISGYRNSPHHRGENPQKTVYDDLTLLLRDSTHIEAGMNFAEKGNASRAIYANAI